MGIVMLEGKQTRRSANAATRQPLTALASEVLRLRFGAPAPRTHAEVAQLLGMRVAAVQRIEERALRSLRATALEPGGEPVAAGRPLSAANLVRLHLRRGERNDWDEV